ncbi:MAG: ornithine carbamoyltransferase [Gemmatimonadota bacterium]|uniref:ornithine carbamoyltransferase n=1 Tax=Candidatus Palauibacter scopulicola TaxID=3056741 RepID=UPI0023827799|nr:ornithine carbamoyltransferase [Candidatus Palauibacter scopulicola]MDE2663167.1 ornithine carbamoyltransferase [Candidatus Palauibacter scopulicola]
MDRTRHFLSIADWSPERLREALDLADRLKADPDAAGRPLAGKSLAMIFTKSSTRTRVSFQVGMHQLGGQALFLSSRDIQIGRGEPLSDTALVLSRFVHGIMIRTFAQSDVEALAEHGSIPVINGLTDLLHPCQVMADLQTARAEFGPDLSGRTVAWIGDGNNVANSWLNAAAKLGFQLRLACPEGYDPDPAILAAAGRATQVDLFRAPAEAAEGAHVVTTDVWASMGQEEEAAERARAFEGYHVDAEIMARAANDAIFLHCLPAHRGEEVAAEVIDGPASRVWDEAENRLHSQKAILTMLMGAAS